MKASRRLVVFAAELVEKTLDEQGDIFLALAERRQLQRNDVEAVIQVLAETAVANQLHQIFVGGGKDANVDLDRIGAAEAHEFALLNDAKELGLCFRANRGDFVKEDRPLVGHFEKAFLRSDGAGEGALHMAEELRFEQIDGDGTSVDGDESFLRARGCGVDCLGDEFLAGAALAANQHGGTGGGDLRDEIEDGEHLLALANDAREVVALLQGALELHVFFAQAAALDRERDLSNQLIVGPGLGDVVLSAALEGGPGHVDRAVRRDQDDRDERIAAVNLAEKLDTIAVGQAYVEKHQVEGTLFQLLQAGFAGFGKGNLEILGSEERFKTFADFCFVVYN